MTIENFPHINASDVNFPSYLKTAGFALYVVSARALALILLLRRRGGGGGRYVNTAIARCYALSSRSVLLVTPPRNAGMESLAYAVGEAAFKIPNAWGVSRTITGFVFMMNYSLIALEHLLGGKEVVI